MNGLRKMFFSSKAKFRAMYVRPSQCHKLDVVPYTPYNHQIFIYHIMIIIIIIILTLSRSRF